MSANLRAVTPANLRGQLVDVAGPDSRLDGFHLVGDIYDVAVTRLVCAGFSADVRRFRLDPIAELRTVAVYVQARDVRLVWSANGVPLGHHYRRNDRCGHDFTIFSGANARVVASFVERLLHPLEVMVVPTAPVAASTGEWDPHRLPESQQESLNGYMARLEAMHSFGAPSAAMK